MAILFEKNVWIFLTNQVDGVSTPVPAQTFPGLIVSIICNALDCCSVIKKSEILPIFLPKMPSTLERMTSIRDQIRNIFLVHPHPMYHVYVCVLRGGKIYPNKEGRV